MKRNIYYDNENISDELAANVVFLMLPEISKAIEWLDNPDYYPPYIVEYTQTETSDRIVVLVHKNKQSISVKIIKYTKQ